MTRGGKFLGTSCVIVGVLLLVGFLVVAQPKDPVTVHVSSPDGTWSVMLFGMKFEDTGFRECSYEMYVNLLDSEGRVVGSKIVGFAPDLASAERDFAISFESNDVVRIGKKSFKKDDLR
jgi:hypothetical protein